MHPKERTIQTAEHWGSINNASKNPNAKPEFHALCKYFVWRRERRKYLGRCLKTSKHIQDSKSKTKNTPKGKDISNCTEHWDQTEETRHQTKSQNNKKQNHPQVWASQKQTYLLQKTARLLPLAPEAPCCRADKNRNMDFHLLSKHWEEICNISSLARKEMHSMKGAKTGYMLTLGAPQIRLFLFFLVKLTKNNLLWFHLDIC